MMQLAAPQPIGIFEMPGGYLLLPALGDAARQAALLESLGRGERDLDWPPAWEFFHLALQGKTEDAARALGGGGDPLARYNAFVLHPGAVTYARLRPQLDAPLDTMLDVVAYTLGLIDVPPPVGACSGEFAALAEATRAADALARGNTVEAIALLDRAAEAARPVSPLLAAQLLAHQAELLRETPDEAPRAIARYQQAMQLAERAALESFRAELWLGLGMAYQLHAGGGRGPLLEAIKCYQSAIQCGLSVEQSPQAYAHAQTHIGLAYLTMPMKGSSDQLRMAVAVQSFREALKVYTKDRYPQLWASTQLNLANALQYLPSSQPQEKLIEAVAVYDDVLTVRDRATDPVGYARVLLNQANALAHLGIFGPAMEKLAEARKLLLWHEDFEAAAAATELAEKIHELRSGGPQRVQPGEACTPASP